MKNALRKISCKVQVWQSLSEPRRRIASNLVWLGSDKIVQIIDSLLVGALVARYLGPGQVGIIASASSIVAMCLAFATLGFDSVVVRDLVKHPDLRGLIFWSLTATRLFAALMIFSVVSVGVISFCETAPERDVLVIIASTLLSSPLAMARLLLEADVQSKWQVWVANAVLMVSAAARLSLVMASGVLIWFAAVIATANLLTPLAVFVLAWHLGIIPRFQSPSKSVAAKYIRECWPVILSSLSVGLYMNIDVVMLRSISGTEAAGVYSIATRLSAAWYFIPLILATTFLPSLAKLHSIDRVSYELRLRWFLDVNSVASYICVAIALVFFPSLVLLLFGNKFLPSVSVVTIHIWALPFVFQGVARSQHLTLESLHQFNLLSTLIGLVANIGLNLLLIPEFGPHGAAAATVTSYCIAAYLTSFLVTDLRRIGWYQTASFIFGPWRLVREPVA